MGPPLDELSKRVLRLLLERKVVSGWEIASAVGGAEHIKAAVEPLTARDFVDFSGDLNDPERMLKSFVNLKPSAVATAKQILTAS